MNQDTLKTVILSLIRHTLSLLGGALLVKDHDNELSQIAGAVAVLIPVVWSAIKSHQEKAATASAVAQLNPPAK